jgi:acylphosphatase
MNDNVFRMNCWFEGHVQGVGFRYQTMGVAKGFEVAGGVQNLADGRVWLCAEGEESEVRAFQAAVAEELKSYIRYSRVQTEEGPRTWQGFRILQ